MSRLRWLNPLMWWWAIYGAARGLSIVLDTRDCPDCDLGDRGELVPFDDLCDSHQEAFRAVSPHAEEKWREWWVDE